jgi:hypothetical protein
MALTGLPRNERVQLAEYLGRAAADQPTQRLEDEQMRALMKAAVARLSSVQRERLGELHEAAIRAALGSS